MRGCMTTRREMGELFVWMCIKAVGLVDDGELVTRQEEGKAIE